MTSWPGIRPGRSSITISEGSASAVDDIAPDEEDAEDCTIYTAQGTLKLPADARLRTVPADGDCFFHCVQRGLGLDASIGELRHLAHCPEGWADEEAMTRLANVYGIRIATYPLEVSQARHGVDFSTALYLGGRSSGL